MDPTLFKRYVRRVNILETHKKPPIHKGGSAVCTRGPRAPELGCAGTRYVTVGAENHAARPLEVPLVPLGGPPKCAFSPIISARSCQVDLSPKKIQENALQETEYKATRQRRGDGPADVLRRRSPPRGSVALHAASEIEAPNMFADLV